MLSAYRIIKVLVWAITITLFASCTGHSLFGESEEEARSWCIFRGNSTLNGYTQRRLPDQPVLQWTYRADKRTVASPIVNNGTCYTCDRHGVLRGIDESGNPCFEHDMNTLIESNFYLQDSVLYIGQMDGVLTAFSLRDNRNLWQFETEGQISASPNCISTSEGNQILVGSYDNYMYALDATSGRLEGKFETGYYINGATALHGRYMIFGGCDAWVRIVDTQSGTPTDSLQLKAYIPASPVVLDNYAYVADYSGDLYELELHDGHIVSHRMLVEAQLAAEENSGMTSMPVVTEKRIFLFSQGRYLSCLNRQDGQELWRVMLRGDVGESSPLVCRDRILVCTRDGHVSILQVSDGQEFWHFEAGEQIISSPAVVRDAFYILTARGTLFRFSS